MQQAADQKRAQRVVTTNAVAVGGVGETETRAECKPGVGCAWAPSTGCGLTLVSEGRELLATARALSVFFASPAFCLSAAFAISAFLAFSFSCAFRTPLADAFLCTIYVESNHRNGKQGTYEFALGQRDVDYLCAALLQLAAFANLAISRVKQRISSCPLQKARLCRQAARIVIVALGLRGDRSRGCESM